MLILAIGLLLQAAPVAVPPPVQKETAHATTLWDSYAGYQACQEAFAVWIRENGEALVDAKGKTRSGAAARSLSDIAIKKRDRACEPVRILELPEGQAIELSSNPASCSVSDSDKKTKLARARVKAGPSAGTVGCVELHMLRDPVAF